MLVLIGALFSGARCRRGWKTLEDGMDVAIRVQGAIVRQGSLALAKKVGPCRAQVQGMSQLRRGGEMRREEEPM